MANELNTGAKPNDPGFDFIEDYLSVMIGPTDKRTECPTFFHRWCALSLLGAYLGRQFTVQLGHEQVYTNQYILLVGEPGTRKSTAIKIAKKILARAGYKTFSAERTTKEKFFLDLEGKEEKSQAETFEAALDSFDVTDPFAGDEKPRECYILQDEFADFVGHGNAEFISILGSWWNYEGTYENRIKGGRSVKIPDPTINILGGTTATGFAQAFPPEIMGQGFLSRLLLVHGESTSKKIVFPESPEEEEIAQLVERLHYIKTHCCGKARISEGANKVFEEIYVTFAGLEDTRFASYANRRFTHLLKLALILTAAKGRTTVTEDIVIKANTILTHTEHLMPKALGQFGKAKNADSAHRIVTFLSEEMTPLDLKSLWKKFSQEFDKMKDLQELLQKLSFADKIQQINGKFTAKRRVIVEVADTSHLIDWDYLTEQERSYTK